MTHVSVLTLTSDRTPFLKNLLTGLAHSSQLPDECIVIHMNESASADQRLPFPCYRYQYSSDIQLPLGQARNVAAQQAAGDVLVFLDVDCIPSREMVAAYVRACRAAPNSILMGQVNYLAEGASVNWQSAYCDGALRSQSNPHPKRDASMAEPLSIEPDYGLFWSLSFALTRELFDRLGGFSDCYPSYGAEDTDFAWKARANNIPLRWVPDAVAYHQWHTSSVPPVHNFDSIVYNAKVFYQRWQEWPMGSWLSAFVEKGYIDWSAAGDVLTVLKRPSQARDIYLTA